MLLSAALMKQLMGFLSLDGVVSSGSIRIAMPSGVFLRDSRPTLLLNSFSRTKKRFFSFSFKAT
jgi:hypothetical protein